MKKFVAEFKEFINKGNLVGIAIGFVMGVAVGALVKSLVDNIIMPIIAIPFGKPSFDEVMIITINDSQIRVGSFITAVVTFLAIAVTVFFMLKAYNRVVKPGEDAPAQEVVLLKGILEEVQGMRADASTGQTDGPSTS